MDAFDSAGVTGIVWRRVKPGQEPAAEAVMREIMAVARTAAGFLGSEIFPPIPGVQDGYVVLYRFARGADLRTWLVSERRHALLARMTELLVEPATEFFFAHGRQPAGSASSVFAYRVRADREAAFQEWRGRILEAVRRFDGFLGTESFDTLGGTEPEFIVVVRFDNRAHLDAWLESDVRRQFMREVRAYVDRVSLRRIGSGFEGWFEHGKNTAPPARWRQALVILSVLFPVIMVMRRLLTPVFGALPMPVAFLILLALDLVVLTYVVMPWYSRRMDFWLRPRADATWRTDVAGLAIIAGILGVTLAIFLALGTA